MNDLDANCHRCRPLGCDCSDSDRPEAVDPKYTPLKNRGCHCGADFDGRDCMCFESDPDWCRSCGESGDAGTHCATPKWHIRYENPHWRDPQEKARMIDAVHARQIREHGIPTAADLVEISNIIWDKPPCEGWDEMVQSFLDDPMTQYSGMSEEMMPLLKESHRKFHDCPAFKPEYNV